MREMKKKIDEELKTAMLEKNNTKRDILRVVKAEISREEAGLKVYGDKEVINLVNHPHLKR